MWQVYLNFSLLSVIILLFIWKYNYTLISHKIIGYLCVVNILFHSIAAYHFIYTKQNNQFVFHILTPIQFSLYSFFFYTLFIEHTIKRVILLSIPLFILISLSISFTIQKTDTYNSYSLSLQNMLLVIWSLLYFMKMIENDEFTIASLSNNIIVVTGIFFFCLSDFILESLMSYLIKNDNKNSILLYYISEILSFVMYCFFIVSFWRIKK